MSENFKIKINPIRWLLPVLSFWLIIILSAYGLSILSFDQSPVTFVLLFVVVGFFVGIFQHHLAILGHDGSHGLVAKNIWLNNLLTTLFVFGPLFANLTNYRNFHGQHHQFLGTDDDAEMPLKKVGEKQYRSPQQANKYLQYFFKDLFLFGGLKEMINFILFMLKGKVIATAVTWLFSWSVIVFPLYLVTESVGFIVMLFALWYFGLVFSFWASFRLRIYFEHVGYDAFAARGYQETKTQTIEFAPKLFWFRFLSCWWGVYHIYHHINQDVPIYQLRAFKSHLEKAGLAPKPVYITKPFSYLENLGYDANFSEDEDFDISTDTPEQAVES